MILQDTLTLLPELIIALGAMVLLLFGVFIKYEASRIVNTVAIVILGIAFAAEFMNQPTGVSLFFYQLANDEFIKFSKFLILGIAILVTISNRDFLKNDMALVPEYSVLILFSVLGMMVMVSAKSFLSLFLGLELQSLSLYVLTAIRRDDLKSSEAGLKYFLLGSLATGIMLYGMTFIYGLVGNLCFMEIKAFLAVTTKVPLSFYLGLLFIIAGVAFKISAVPFHMWAPDVYEGAPTIAVSFFSSVPKVAAFCMMTRLLYEPLFLVKDQWTVFIMALAVVTMIVGVLGALFQKNIKRLLAYSSIMNMGYAMLGLVAADVSGLQASLVYIAIYGVSILGFFICLLIVSRRGHEVQDINDLSGLYKKFPCMTFIMSFLLFSFAGVPPLAGFFGKLYIFQAILHAEMLSIAILGVLVSVIAAGYYLYVIKVMVMDTQPPGNLVLATDGEYKEYGALIVTGAIVTGLTWFFIKPGFFLSIVASASKALLIQ